MGRYAGNQLCIYCQKAGATTRDHVPPKLLFPKPRPSTLVTVPACEPCNKQAELDDQDFRTYLGARPETEDDPIAKQLGVASLARFDRRPAYYEGWLQRTQIIEVVDEKGRLVGTKMQFKRDYDRLSNVVLRTVKGLHFKLIGKPLPLDCPMAMLDHGGFEKCELEPGTKISEFLEGFRDAPVHTIHPDIFSYQRESVVGDELTAVWLLRFLKQHWFLVLVNCEVD